jgi:predicted Zn-dependent protease
LYRLAARATIALEYVQKFQGNAVNFDKLDNDELLRLSLEAINTGRDPEAVVMLKTLLERDSQHTYGQYLLAAQHAQMGMMDRAEAGFRAVVARSPEFPMARFQLAQLLLAQSRPEEAKQQLAPLVLLAEGQALGAYARALAAAADDDLAGATAQLRAGLGWPQEIPALAMDMQRLLGALTTNSISQEGASTTIAPAQPASSLFLTGYGRSN